MCGGYEDQAAEGFEVMWAAQSDLCRGCCAEGALVPLPSTIFS
jgi:hypothetical protein